MKEFRTGASRVLISTDVLGRGIDVQQINLVINYDMPRGYGEKETYIHRIGRTARGTKNGVAISFTTE